MEADDQNSSGRGRGAPGASSQVIQLGVAGDPPGGDVSNHSGRFSASGSSGSGDVDDDDLDDEDLEDDEETDEDVDDDEGVSADGEGGASGPPAPDRSASGGGDSGDSDDDDDDDDFEGDDDEEAREEDEELEEELTAAAESPGVEAESDLDDASEGAAQEASGDEAEGEGEMGEAAERSSGQTDDSELEDHELEARDGSEEEDAEAEEAEGDNQESYDSPAPEAPPAGSDEYLSPPIDMERPRRAHHVAPAHVLLDRVDDDTTFQLRPEGDCSLLATDLARLGQLYPIDLRLVPPDRFQIISGFRRVAALRFLQREKVLARLHIDLSDEDALLMALAQAIHSTPVSREDLGALKDRLEQEGRMGAAVRDMLEKALAPPEGDLAPEEVGEDDEVDADELSHDITQRLGEINQDLSLLAEVFAVLDDERKKALLEQLRYSSELVKFLEEKE
jgi:ParB family chromosome partitioning protein